MGGDWKKLNYNRGSGFKKSARACIASASVGLEIPESELRASSTSAGFVLGAQPPGGGVSASEIDYQMNKDFLFRGPRARNSYELLTGTSKNIPSTSDVKHQYFFAVGSMGRRPLTITWSWLDCGMIAYELSTAAQFFASPPQEHFSPVSL